MQGDFIPYTYILPFYNKTVLRKYNKEINY